MKAFKCPNCAGDIKYDIRKAVMTCEHCGCDIPREAYQKYLDENSLYVTNELVCPQCGAAMLSYDDTIATFCAYCGSSVSFTRRIVEDVKPDGIIPFSVSSQRALQCYRNRLKKAVFAPDWLWEGGEQKVVGIYMPFYSFSATAAEHVKTSGTRPSDEEFNAEEEYKIEFDVNGEYSGFRFDASKAFPDYLSRSIDTYEESPEPGDEKAVFSQNDMFVKEDEETLRGSITWLVPSAQKNAMEPILVELGEGGQTQEMPPSEGEEFGYVLSGSILLHVGGRHYRVKTGESFCLHPGEDHYIQNSGKRKAQFIWVSTPPTF